MSHRFFGDYLFLSLKSVFESTFEMRSFNICILLVPLYGPQIIAFLLPILWNKIAAIVNLCCAWQRTLPIHFSKFSTAIFFIIPMKLSYLTYFDSLEFTQAVFKTFRTIETKFFVNIRNCHIKIFVWYKD